MSIREIIKTGPVERTEEVTKGKDKYILKGKPDMTLTQTLLMPPHQRDLKARHWARVVELPEGQTIDPEMVLNILVVHQTLQPPEDEEPYDVTEIAKLAAMDGTLFAALLAKAYTVLGFADQSALEMVMGGNSEGQAAPNLNSTSGASAPQDDAQAGSLPKGGN